jgi:methionine synthase II (cobalamin-independent)
MPPSAVHFNGSVNLADAETVMRELASRVPVGVRRIPDGETGDRGNWIFFQLAKFLRTPGLCPAGDQSAESYQEIPKVRLADGTDPDSIAWPDLGYAQAYQESFESFQQLRKADVLGDQVRYQVQYPTPLASINGWVVPEHHDALQPSYTRALFADLERLLNALPHDQLAVQWDVAVEFAILEQQDFASPETQTFTSIAQWLAECVDRVPAGVPLGLHLCYGDFQHQHFVQPRSLLRQVQVLNAVTESAKRPPSWCSFTVPQDQRDPAYFEPLSELRATEQTELYFGLVPYHPSQQEPGTTDAQVKLIDQHLGERAWGISTECGMGRAAADEVPGLLDLHREILGKYSS